MQGKDFPQMAQISGKVTRKQYLGDIGGAADFARSQSFARADRVGVTGFCGGGALTLHTAAEYPGVTAAAPWYGHVSAASIRTRPAWTRSRWRTGSRVPVLGLYGAADTGIKPEDVKAFEALLRSKGNQNVEFVLYPGAPHAFFSDDRPQVYKKDAADDAWRRVTAFFDTYLRR